MKSNPDSENAPSNFVTLDPKAIRFVAEAVEYRLTWYEEQLRRTDLSEDDYSDLSNDRYYFQSILEELYRHGGSTRDASKIGQKDEGR